MPFMTYFREEAVHVKHPSPDYHFKVGQTRKPLLTKLHSPVSIPVIKLVVVNYQGRAARVWPPATKMCTIHVYAQNFPKLPKSCKKLLWRKKREETPPSSRFSARAQSLRKACSQSCLGGKSIFLSQMFLKLNLRIG